MFDTLPAELVEYILSFLPLIDRIKCESINRRFNSICRELWNRQKCINESELPRIRWVREFQTIYPTSSEEIKSDKFRWHLTIKCPRITKIFIDEEHSNSTVFLQRVPFIEHLTVKHCIDNFVILQEASNLETIVFKMSYCNEYNLIKHLPIGIKCIEGPPITSPWVDKWDEIFKHSKSGQFLNLVKLAIVISLQNDDQLENILKLQQLIHVRFLMGDEFENHFVVKYLQLCGSKLRRLELFQPNYHISCRSVYAAVNNNCFQLEQLGIKGYLHGKQDYNDFKNFLYNFKNLKLLSMNILRTLNEEEIDTVCYNNHNLEIFEYSYYMPSISPQKLKNHIKNCDEIRHRIDSFNDRNPDRKKIRFETSDIIYEILSNMM